MAAACGTAWLVREVAGSGEQGGGPFMGRVDYRAVAFGALLPDLIDKPLVWFVFRDADLAAHHVGHSLLFSLVLLAVGVAVAARGDNRLLLIAFGALTHIFYDSLTHVPWSIFYPFVELDVPHSGFLPREVDLAGEVLALIALVIFFIRPRPRERAALFIHEGRIET